MKKIKPASVDGPLPYGKGGVMAKKAKIIGRIPVRVLRERQFGPRPQTLTTRPFASALRGIEAKTKK